MYWYLVQWVRRYAQPLQQPTQMHISLSFKDQRYQFSRQCFAPISKNIFSYARPKIYHALNIFRNALPIALCLLLPCEEELVVFVPSDKALRQLLLRYVRDADDERSDWVTEIIADETLRRKLVLGSPFFKWLPRQSNQNVL